MDYQDLLTSLSSVLLTDLEDCREWPLEPLGIHQVNPLSNHLNCSPSTYKLIYAALWKSKSPRKINIPIWIMINGSLNTSQILQKKLPKKSLLPSVCPLCLEDGECLKWVFTNCFRDNVLQTVVRPSMSLNAYLLWISAVKGLSYETKEISTYFRILLGHVSNVLICPLKIFFMVLII